MGAFPSGQRGQTVNLLSTTSVVRIHPLPPSKTAVPPGTAVLLGGSGQRSAPSRSGGGRIPAAIRTCAGGTCSAEARRLRRRGGSGSGVASPVPPGTAVLLGGSGQRPAPTRSGGGRIPGLRPRDRPGLSVDFPGKYQNICSSTATITQQNFKVNRKIKFFC